MAVVMIHVSCYYCYTCSWGADWLTGCVFDAMCRWSVPVFFMASGLVFIESNSLTVRSLWTKYIPRLLLIFVAWNLIYKLGLEPLTHVIKHEAVDYHAIIPDLRYPYLHLWFLPVLIGLYILLPVFRLVKNHLDVLQYFICVWFVACLLMWIFPSVLEVMNLKWLVGYPGYFVLGYYLHHANLPRSIRRLIYSLGLVSLFAVIGLTAYYKYQFGIFNETFFEYLSPFTIMMSSAIFLAVKNAKRVSMVLRKISLPLLGVYLTHYFYVSFFYRSHFLNYLPDVAVIRIVIIFAVCLGLSVLTTYCLSKIPFVRKIVS